MEENKKYEVEFKQSAKGSWYIGSIKIGVDDEKEFEEVMGKGIEMTTKMIKKLNGLVADEEFGIDKISKSRGKSLPELDENKRRLYDLFCEKRLEIARKKEVAPFVIFHNSVLADLALKMPTTKEEFLEIEGVGEKKFEDYGEMILEMIREIK